MTSKRIEIIVSPQGTTRVQTHGFQGVSCRQASAFIEQALGQREQETFTPEFYQTAQQNEQHQQRE